MKLGAYRATSGARPAGRAETLKTTHTYDSSGRLTSTTGPTGATASTSYDETAGPAHLS
jgi:YD repeat-containing protein